MTGANGQVAPTVAVANLGTGPGGTVTGCAWTTVCATWTLYGVDPSEWQISAGRGAGQSVASTTNFGSVTFVVTDSAGHLLGGAPVTIYQRVLAWEGDCGAAVRCPSAPVLATLQTTAQSGLDGVATVTPLEVAGVPQVVQMPALTGTQGSVTTTLVKMP